MVLVLEKEGTKRSTLDIAQVEVFTQKPFIDLVNAAHASFNDYFLARVTKQDLYYEYYDARQLCKYIFELQISSVDRKIKVKNNKDPISHETMISVHFFRIMYGTETPLRAEYMGDKSDFLESYCFRSKMFYKEDPLYALNVNFVSDTQKIPFLSRKHVFSLFITIIFILLISTFLIVLMEKDSKNGIGTDKLKLKVKKQQMHINKMPL